MNINEIKEVLNKELITVEDVQRILDVSPNTVIRKIHQGRLEGINISPDNSKATWRIRSISVKRLLGIEDNTQVPA